MTTLSVASEQEEGGPKNQRRTSLVRPSPPPPHCAPKYLLFAIFLRLCKLFGMCTFSRGHVHFFAGAICALSRVIHFVACAMCAFFLGL